MIKKIRYRSTSLMLAMLAVSIFYMPSTCLSQEKEGEKLQVIERKKPSNPNLNNRKIKTSKRKKIKAKREKSKIQISKINPFKWDWNKVMLLKAKKSDYRTYKYNPNKKTKRLTYDNQPNYESADREAITNPSKLRKPDIPYNKEIANEGRFLQKKSSPKNIDLKNVGPTASPPTINLNDPSETLSKSKKRKRNTNIDGDKLYTRSRKENGKSFDNHKLETAQRSDVNAKMDDNKIMSRRNTVAYSKMDKDKLLTVEAPQKKIASLDKDKLMTIRSDGERKKYDDSKLMTAKSLEKGAKQWDDKKLMTVNTNTKNRDSYDDDKLMTIKMDKNERSTFDNNKLMTSKPANTDRQKYDEDKLMIASRKKIEVGDLHDDRLLTVVEKRKPTDEMKQSSKDISNLDGNYVRHFYVGADSHPGTKILAAENTRTPFLSRTFQSVSSFFSNIWTDETQPNYVTRKKPREKRDKGEAQIWDSSVHPSQWKKQEAESSEQK